MHTDAELQFPTRRLALQWDEIQADLSKLEMLMGIAYTFRRLTGTRPYGRLFAKYDALLGHEDMMFELV
jgi:hypothetical protein